MRPESSARLSGMDAPFFRIRSIFSGLKGLLVLLTERSGGQYYASPPPPASAQWKTVVIPFTSFKKASWARDSNNRFDLSDLHTVSIGAHGVARRNNGKWTIEVANVQLVP